MSIDKDKIISEQNQLLSNQEKEIGELKRKEMALRTALDEAKKPIQMRLPCPFCHKLHIDDGEFTIKPHHTHACQNCGMVWRPAIINTVGVQFLPGFKNEIYYNE